jgi:hypothetical protein
LQRLLGRFALLHALSGLSFHLGAGLLIEALQELRVLCLLINPRYGVVLHVSGLKFVFFSHYTAPIGELGQIFDGPIGEPWLFLKRLQVGRDGRGCFRVHGGL